MADSNQKIICNPHSGKPAYVTASLPCDKVFKPCNLQEAPDNGGGSTNPEDEALVTPDCVSIVFSSNSSETVPSEFSYNETSGNYTDGSGNTIIYDIALGWIIQTGTASYLPVTKTTNPTNNYCDSNGEVVSVVDCTKVGSAFSPPAPNCVETVFAEDENLVLGQFQGDGSGGYTPDITEQGTLMFMNGSGWQIVANGVAYTGSSEESQVTGLYVNSNDQCILVKECS